MHVRGAVTSTSPHRLCRPAAQEPHSGARVAREFVHRLSVDDILITSWQRVDDRHFSVSARWPHDHGYFTPRPLILTAETIRQAGLLLSHAELGVPVGHHFILEDLAFTMHPERLDTDTGPTLLRIDVVCGNLRMRAGMLASGRFGMTAHTPGGIVATGHSHVTVASPAAYRRIRGERLTARHTPGLLPIPIPPQLTGSDTEHEVLLSPAGGPNRWLLRIAPGHAAVVKPTSDHVPGMVLVDAALQAAYALTAPDRFVPHTLGTEFHRYAEHGTPCVLEARRVPLPGTTTVQVTGVQDGETVFVSTFTAPDGRG